MFTRADRIDEDGASREQRDDRVPVFVTHPPLPTRVTSIADVIKRSATKHRKALEILAKR